MGFGQVDRPTGGEGTARGGGARDGKGLEVWGRNAVGPGQKVTHYVAVDVVAGWRGD